MRNTLKRLEQKGDKPRKITLDSLVNIVIEHYPVKTNKEYEDYLRLAFDRKKEVEGDFFSPTLPDKTRLCFNEQCLNEVLCDGHCHCCLFEHDEEREYIEMEKQLTTEKQLELL